MTLAVVLDDCLQRLQRGESLEACLQRYPAHARELAPMLAAAAQLTALHQVAPSAAQNTRTLVALREAAAQRRAQPQRTGLLGRLTGFAPGRLALTAALMLLLFTTFSAGVVASSRPGQVAYSLRVLAERAPAVTTFDRQAGAAAELRIADRRLSDLESHLIRAGQVEPAALRALLAGDRAAAQRAQRADEVTRQTVVERLTDHARVLHALSRRAADAQDARILAEAALIAERLLRQVQAAATPSPLAPAPLPLSSPTPSPTPLLPAATATPGATSIASPTATATPTSPVLVHTATLAAIAPTAIGPTSEVQGVPPSAVTPQPVGSVLPPRPRLTERAETATALAQTPRPRLTERAETATALAQTPMPQSTLQPQPADTPQPPAPQPTASVPPLPRPRPRP